MPLCVEVLEGAAYLAFPQLRGPLTAELTERFGADPNSIESFGDLLFLKHPPRNADASPAEPLWCRTAMKSPFRLSFDSTGEAASYLSSIQRSWAAASSAAFRRTALIKERLPYVNEKPRRFPFVIPRSPIGLFCLTEPHSLIASAETSSPLPAGALSFCEDREGPPSRAYLKLWEALVRAEHAFSVFPRPGERCLDAGASPGGWSWVLLALGCSVLSIDRAELAPSLMAHPSLSFRRHDAFTLSPQELGSFDWVCSDVICYPERLLEWTERWRASGLCRAMICTIKLQGATDWPLIEAFAAVPSSLLVHLNYNKHEFTWIWKRPD